uniref:Uncharacterized protein n=1 Tax=Rhizophora mucronata TaxID=61149 RepID=A0A2P2P574_RHIMU
MLGIFIIEMVAKFPGWGLMTSTLQFLPTCNFWSASLAESLLHKWQFQ